MSVAILAISRSALGKIHHLDLQQYRPAASGPYSGQGSAGDSPVRCLLRKLSGNGGLYTPGQAQAPENPAVMIVAVRAAAHSHFAVQKREFVEQVGGPASTSRHGNLRNSSR